MIDLNEILPLTVFQRNTKAHLRRLKETGTPLVLTINGRAEVVVQDAGAYQKLTEAITRAEARAEALEGIRSGLEKELEQMRPRPVRALAEAIAELDRGLDLEKP
jgi:PHD/YefM family antitoxin component YafN of YafNO toxin-antitoxin module